ncbi:MAG: hypothetical protein LIO92_02320 [Clostridiales bacterium]|nr:hypothetical protein [Clostridiales bacterium]
MTDSEKLDLLLEKVSGMESRLGSVEGRLDSVENRLDSMDTRLNSMDTRLNSMDTRLNHIEADHETTKAEIKTIKITLENETNRNIQLIAEGHMNLDRKLDEALTSLHSNTMYHLKVNHLDAEVKHIKEHLGIA